MLNSGKFIVKKFYFQEGGVVTGFNKGSSQQLFQFRLSDFIISNNGILKRQLL